MYQAKGNDDLIFIYKFRKYNSAAFSVDDK
jgi:hypothetical protein